MDSLARLLSGSLPKQRRRYLRLKIGQRRLLIQRFEG